MNLSKELPVLLLVLLPFAYLAFIWNGLPAEVPVHWNIKGEADRYGSKSQLLLIPILLPLLTYGLLTIVPIIDPRKRLTKMGGKLTRLKFILTAFMSALALFILYTAQQEGLSNPNHLLALIGVIVFVLGNYFKTIESNYFIGIRTPWTLQSETVWKTTHELAGKLWFAGGLLIFILSLVLSTQLNFAVFLSIMAIITLVPIIYSYREFQKVANHQD